MGRKSKKGQWDKTSRQSSKKVKTNEWQQDKIGKADIFITSFNNIMFKHFYEIQLLQTYFKGDQIEFDQFWDYLSQPLPVSFRINPTQKNYQNLIQRLQSGELIKSLVGQELGSLQSDKILQPVPWYPDHLAWESKLAKKELRKTTQLTKLHSFIQKCSATGLLTRQEVVSMLPPLFLDPQPGEYVLDMCAAPGSKTCQMLEMMSSKNQGIASGCLIANDVDQKRSYMLTHQLNRLPTAQIVITNHAAQFFPSLSNKGTRILFDKILCDVPCTGDGAARKLPTRWMNWSARDGNAIHPLQLSILMRALSICKVGGLVLYSTCSLNPIEDEAVVADVFRRVQEGALEILDFQKLENFKVRNGLTNWKVIATDDILYKEYLNHNKETLIQQDQKFNEPHKIDDILENLTAHDFLHEIKSLDQIPSLDKLLEVKEIYTINQNHSKRQNNKYSTQVQGIRPSLFPDSEEYLKKIGIEKTIRILPHDQDTGGFYLAMFRKKQSIVWSRPRYPEHILGKFKFQQQEEYFNYKKKQNNEGDENEQLDMEDLQIDQQLLEKVLLNNDQAEEENLNFKLKTMKKDKVHESNLLGEKLDGIKPNTFKKKAHLQAEDYSPMNDYDWKILSDYYGIDPTFPREQILGSEQGLDDILNPSRKFRFVTKEVQNLLNHDPQKHLKTLNIGCKILERGKESFGGFVTPFKICQEGLHYILPYITKRLVQTSLDSFMFLIEKQNIKEDQLQDKQLLEAIKIVGQGCFILYIKNGVELSDAVVCQYFRNSISLMCTSEFSENFLIRHGRI